MVYGERVLPHSTEAEEGVIGSILLDGSVIAELQDLRPSDFFVEPCRHIYEVCLDLHAAGAAIDQLTVADELARRGWLADVGGHAYLGSVIGTLPTSLHAEGYADIVRKLALFRSLIEAGSELAAMGYESGEVQQSLARGDALLAALRARTVVGNVVTLRMLLDQFLAQMAEAQTPTATAFDGARAAVPTGFADLDQLLGGLQRGDVVIVAARPSVGKSALAVTIARNAAMNGARVGIVSLEMANHQVRDRLLAAETGIDTHRLRLHLYSGNEEDGLIIAAGRLSDLRVYLDDRPAQGTKAIASWARYVQSHWGLDLLVVDYLQLIQGVSNRPEYRVQEVSQASRDLKLLARELGIPVLVCSQLNRQIEGRSNHRPMLSDLRDSGSIEQDADVVMFIHREELYTTEEEWQLRNPDRPYPKDLAEIIVAKHRNGPVGSLFLRFNGRLARFEDVTGAVYAAVR